VASSLHHLKRAIQRRIVRTTEHDWPIQKARFLRWRGLDKSVLSLIEGEAVHPGSTHAIFVMWQPAHTSWSVWNMLGALDRAGINVTLVVNHPLADERLGMLAKRCARLMMRDNSGRDMGGYRDATLLLQREFRPDRVLYLNDSVFVFERGLDALIGRLARSTSDVCSAFECWLPRHHYQSFCYSVSGTLFHSPAWQRFWTDYLPADSRRWAIRKGEIGASAVMNRSSASIEVIFALAEIQKRLSAMPKDELSSLVGYLPHSLRPAADEIRRMDRHALLRRLADEMMSMSQIHTSGMLARRFLDCPLMKRDLVFRSLYSINEIEILLDEIGHEGYAAEILTDLRKKGSEVSRGSWDRARIRVGVL
jgi:hypothetical protein